MSDCVAEQKELWSDIIELSGYVNKLETEQGIPQAEKHKGLVLEDDCFADVPRMVAYRQYLLEEAQKLEAQ